MMRNTGLLLYHAIVEFIVQLARLEERARDREEGIERCGKVETANYSKGNDEKNG